MTTNGVSHGLDLCAGVLTVKAIIIVVVVVLVVGGVAAAVAIASGSGRAATKQEQVESKQAKAATVGIGAISVVPPKEEQGSARRRRRTSMSTACAVGLSRAINASRYGPYVTAASSSTAWWRHTRGARPYPRRSAGSLSSSAPSPTATPTALYTVKCILITCY